MEAGRWGCKHLKWRPTRLRTFIYGNKVQLHNNMPSFQLNLAAIEWKENEQNCCHYVFMAILLRFMSHTTGGQPNVLNRSLQRLDCKLLGQGQSELRA